MSADKSTLDRLMAMPRKELVDDVVFYHDGWVAAGRECNELKAENAKLRDDLETQRETAWHNTKRNAREYKRVRDENDRLRELVRDAWGSGHPDRSCEGCDIRDECHDDTERLRKDGIFSFSRCLFELRIEERMRELGIEVG